MDIRERLAAEISRLRRYDPSTADLIAVDMVTGFMSEIDAFIEVVLAQGRVAEAARRAAAREIEVDPEPAIEWPNNVIPFPRQH